MSIDYDGYGRFAVPEALGVENEGVAEEVCRSPRLRRGNWLALGRPVK